MIARQTQNKYLEGWALNGIGYGLCHHGHFTKSIEFHKQALATWQGSGDLWETGICLRNLGESYRQLRQFDQAMKHYTQAEEVFNATGDQRRQSNVWEGRAAVAVEMGRYADAIDLYGHALTVDQNCGYRYFEVGVLIGLGVAWQRSGEARRARHYWEQALTICQTSRDDRTEEIYALLNDLDN
jgi:tetratricopeptide (TPR) repeat protein